jgi:hypothetical protein
MYALAAALTFAAVAVADDLIPPPWDRGDPGTTYQCWDTWIPGGPGEYLPDNEFNPYGQPYIYDPNDMASVVPEYDGRPDVMIVPDGWWLEIMLPNDPTPNPRKDIYLQMVWHWDGAPDIPEVYDPPTGWGIEITDEFDLGDPTGWWYTRYHIWIEPNPDFEEIDLWPADPFGPMIIDQIVIDTICIPTPGGVALLGVAGLMFLKRRR